MGHDDVNHTTNKKSGSMKCRYFNHGVATGITHCRHKKEQNHDGKIGTPFEEEAL